MTWTLAADIHRCHDNQCPQREICARFLDRNHNTGPHTPHAKTLRRPEDKRYYCDLQIHRNPEQ